MYYYITYKNQGKPEKTPPMYKTRLQANQARDFLGLQGATSIQIHSVEWVEDYYESLWCIRCRKESDFPKGEFDNLCREFEKDSTILLECIHCGNSHTDWGRAYAWPK